MVNRNAMKTYFYSVLILALFTACASSDRMLEKGDYDAAIQMAVRKMSGKKKKDVHVLALEEGYERIMRRDLARIESLQSSNRAEDWDEVIHIIKDIRWRQDLVEPFLPLVSETGYRANFEFIQTDSLLADARTTAISLYEKRLVDIVNGARRGNKTSARQATQLIDHIGTLNLNHYRQDLRDEMWNLGITHILVRIENDSRHFLPNDMVDYLLAMDFNKTGNQWDRFYTDAYEDMPIDYEVVLNIQDVYTSPDEWAERVFPYTKEIVDGWEYVLDQNGNVAKDSLGNDIKRDKIVRVNATVVERVQTKRAVVRARMDVVNAHSGARITSRPMEVEDCFSHVARAIYGDLRALDPHLRNVILPVMYPSDINLIRDAFEGLRPKFYNELRRADYPETLVGA